MNLDNYRAGLTVLGYRKNGRPIFEIKGGAPTLVEQETVHDTKAREAAREAKEIAATAKSEGRDLTDDEIARVRQLSADRKAALEKGALLRDAMKELDELSKADQGAERSGKPADEKGADPFDGNIGRAFTKSRGFQVNKGQFQEPDFRASSGRIGSGEEVLFGRLKATIGIDSPASTFPNPVRVGVTDLTGIEDTTLLSLISRGTMSSSSVEYLQITGVTEGAAIVAPGELKPLSDFDTDLKNASAYTYADGFDVANQSLADEPFLASYLQNRLPRHLRTEIQRVLLSGAGTSGEPAGILSTTGVQHQVWAGGNLGSANPDLGIIDTVAAAIQKIEDVDGDVQAIGLAPADYWRLMLLRDNQGRYYSQGPWSQGPGTLWGRPFVKLKSLAAGQALLGDFRTVYLLDREGVSVTAFNQHADYARRNKTYVRAEYRGAQIIVQPNLLCTVDLVVPA